MKTKDYLIIALAPLVVLLIPLIGVLVSPEWKWTWHDFLAAWAVLAATIFAYRLLATRQLANFAYRAGAALAIAASFLITWITMAVQIIGEENPANVFYLIVTLTGLIGLALSRFQPSGLAKTTFTMATLTFLIPVIAVTLWPADFSPGVWRVFVLNSVFVAMFAGAGLLFRRASGRLRAAQTR